MDIHDRNELELSLNLWRAELAKDNRQISSLQKQLDKVRKTKQHAQSMIERRQSQKQALIDVRSAILSDALTQVGVIEHPAGSNAGPRVSAYQKPFGIDEQPWCGAFVGFYLRLHGVDITPRIVYTPYIYEDAVASRNGLRGVVWHDGSWGEQGYGRRIDLVLFDFGTAGGIKHVGFLRKPWNGHGPLYTLEGNTSFGTAGSQDNGGAVALRERDISLVHSIVSVKLPRH